MSSFPDWDPAEVSRMFLECFKTDSEQILIWFKPNSSSEATCQLFASKLKVFSEFPVLTLKKKGKCESREEPGVCRDFLLWIVLSPRFDIINSE